MKSLTSPISGISSPIGQLHIGPTAEDIVVPVEAIQQRDGSYILDRQNNYILTRG